MPPSASTLIALASPSFIALFLLPHTVALVLKLALSLSHSPRSIFHRPYYHKATFTLPALSSFLYAVGGVFSLLGIARYTQDGAESSLERGFRVAQGATQAIGRFGVIVCLLILLSTFGPRSNKRSSRAHLAPFTTIIVAILFALGLASLTLSVYLSIALSNRDVSTATPIHILSITQPSLLLATLLLTLVTFVLLFALFNVAAAISRPDQNRGSFAEDFLASKATQYGVRPTSTATFPPPRLLRHLHYSSTIFKIAPRIVAVTLMGLLGAGLQLADQLLDRDMLDVEHIGLSIGRAVCEVVWIGGVVQIFYSLCQPRPKAQRTHTTEADEDPNSNPHLPPSSSGHHLLHARHQNQSPSLSPLSQDSHRDSAASTTLPHTPATPAFPVAPKSTLFDGIPPSSTESGSQSFHYNHYGSTANANGGIPTLPASSSTMNALGGGGGGSVVGSLTYFATLSEELLALRTDDPFSSPPPGTVVLPKLPPSGTVRRRRGVVVGKAETEARPATAPVSAKPKTKTRPRRSSTSGSLSDGWKPGDESNPIAPESSGGPCSKKAKTAVAGEGAKLTKRTSAKPTFSRRPFNKRRRSGGVGKVKKEAPAETTTTNNRVLHFGDLPSLVPGATRPRPPRNPIPRFSQQIEGVNSLGLIVDDHQPMQQLPPPGPEDARQPTFIALDTTADDTRLLKSVVANALGLNRHQHIQYLEPPSAAAAAVLPQEAVSRADCGVDGGGGDREHPSGSTTPTPQRQEDARLTPRGASPTPESNGSPLRQVTGQKEFKFTTLVDSPTSLESGPHVPFPDPTTIYQRPDFEGPSMLHNPTAALLETFPRTPSFADAAMSLTSSSAASDVQTQPTLSPAHTNSSSFMRTTFNPPSSFEPSAPIDIPAAGPSAAARNLYRRRGLSTSILEATRAIPIVPTPGGGGRGARLHKPNSNSYDAARVRAHLLMAGAEQRQDTATDETNRNTAGLGRNSTERLWSTRILREPAPTGGPARAQQLPPPPPSIGSLDLPLLHSRFSDPTTTGTGSSGGRTCSTAGVDAGSESSFK
ncbi:hypothetical protein FRC04_011369 [Tulasnella sp. 424]|nr:hypothetical protein FRC04_011369 [Tulasnella sp. 424]